MRNPFARIVKADAVRPSLRERTAALKATAARVIRRKPVDAAAAAPTPALGADPIHAAIFEMRRLMMAVARSSKLPLPAGSIDPLPEQTAATDAFRAHIENVLLKTVPTTAAGCAALARYAIEFRGAEGFCLDEDDSNDHHLRILDLIARSPMLDGGRRAPSDPVASGAPFDASGILDRLDFASMPMRSLETLQLHAETLSHVSYGLAAQPRSLKGDTANANEVGELMLWLAEEVFCRLQDSCHSEAERRVAVTEYDREARLLTIARSVICNNDPDELRAFARDLLALVEA